jgi:signal transduction histidine kinase
LPAGTYHLKVKASNTDGVWSNKMATLQIEIIPPFWKTIWAFILYALLLSFISRSVFRFRMNQIKTRNQLHYEKKIRQQEHKIHLERLEFFTNISHELRTPLTLVECAVDDLKSNLKNTRNNKVKESIKTASFHSNRLLELINQLLEFRRIETGNPKLSVEKLNINEWLTEYLSNFKELADNKQISMKLSMPLNTLELFADPDKLSMILNNLLSNAFKFTPKKGTVKISAEEKDNEIIIQVVNSGKGISSKVLPNIFERYFKTESKSTSTGIGLSLTKSLVELHQGRIGVESTAGKETRFMLSFLKGSKHFQPEQLKSSSEVSSEKTALLIE